MATSSGAVILNFAMTSGLNSCSIVVFALLAVVSVVEYTILSAPPPHFGEFIFNGRLIRLGRCTLPVVHRLVHPTSKQVRADRSFELVDKREDFFVRFSPIKSTVAIFHEAVERCDG